MGRRRPVWYLGALACLFFVLTLAGSVVKVKGNGRIAPGIELGGTDLSGLTVEEAEALLTAQLPEVTLELVCLFPPELKEEAEKRVQALKENSTRAENSIEYRGSSIEVRENKLYLTVGESMVTLLMDETMETVYARSREVKVWEWLYAKLFGKSFCVRTVTPEFAWRGECLAELLTVCGDVLEREAKDATLIWVNGSIRTTESRRGFTVDKAATFASAEQVFAEAMDKLSTGWADGISVRVFVSGEVTAPKFTTETAERCNTKIAEFTTTYQGAGTGRAGNIAAGAAHLHGRVILPGEEFSTATALMPFTEENGYASGGTYINGELSESIGGGVCQLSTTLYNALLRTTLTVTGRYPHSLPVGYIPLGQDAAIAGDYKDLCFRNNTTAPILLLCTVDGEEVKVTLSGPAEAARMSGMVESIVTKEADETVTVEVYRRSQAEGGAEIRELISVDVYGKRKE